MTLVAMALAASAAAASLVVHDGPELCDRNGSHCVSPCIDDSLEAITIYR
jgi:hypothetical protein